MSKPYYVIQLEDYTLPSYLPFPKTYYGTLDQIRQLIYLLASEEWTREYYTSTISAMDSFDFGNLAAVHDVAGHMERLLTPVGELCRSTYLCGGAQWYYTDQYGCALPAKAELVDVEQVLLQDGDRYLRCGKFRFEGLSNAMPMNGWDLHDGYCEGLPNMGQYFEPGAIQMRLFVLEQEYANETTARKDMATEGLLDYSRVSGELFSGY
jgi:hypothetical protein